MAMEAAIGSLNPYCAFQEWGHMWPVTWASLVKLYGLKKIYKEGVLVNQFCVLKWRKPIDLPALIDV